MEGSSPREISIGPSKNPYVDSGIPQKAPSGVEVGTSQESNSGTNPVRKAWNALIDKLRALNGSDFLKHMSESGVTTGATTGRESTYNPPPVTPESPQPPQQPTQEVKQA